MKIGILTLPLHTNYGGILQAYALQTILERMGHEVVVFDKPMLIELPPIGKRLIIYTKRIIKKMLGMYSGYILISTPNNRTKIERKYTQQFIDKYIHRYIIRKLSEIHQNDIDAIVVGSDQVWRAYYFKMFWATDMTSAFLGFCEDKIKRISYAASFGTDKWEFDEEETKKCTELIKQFNGVSTREKSGVELCSSYLGYDKCKHVLDPTMLLNKDNYIQLFKSANAPQSEGNMLCYFLDEDDEKANFIEHLSREMNLKPFRVNSEVENPNAPIEKRCQPPVEKWLRGFYDANIVLTDSFHACVFSILFNKPFVAFGNEKRGMSRFTSILEVFGLEKCLITSVNDFSPEILDIDWQNVNRILSEKRSECLSYLQYSINK